MRLFVAIPVPPEQRAELARLQNGVPGARWVEPQSFHLTLRFIGEVDNAHARDIDDQLARIGTHAFELAIKGVGHFMEGGKPSVLFAGVENNPALEALQRRVESAVARAGVAPERRRFNPHVTLARFSGRQDAGHHLAQFMASHSLFRPEPFEVDHFALFSSVTRPEAAIYRIEADYPLQVFEE
jgi:2'-5' RNA ligase